MAKVGLRVFVCATAAISAVGVDCGEEDGTCAEDEVSMLQHRERRLHQASMRTSWIEAADYEGCARLLAKCEPDAARRSQWLGMTWRGWRLGFDVCCAAGSHEPHLCHEVTPILFNFTTDTTGTFQASALVQDTQTTILRDFCTEAGSITDLYTNHVVLDSDLSQTVSLLQNGGKKAASLAKQGASLAKQWMASGRAVTNRKAEARSLIRTCKEDDACASEAAAAISLLKARMLVDDCADFADEESYYNRCRGEVYDCSDDHYCAEEATACCADDCRDEHGQYDAWECQCFPETAQVRVFDGEVRVSEMRSGSRLWSPTDQFDLEEAEHVLELHAGEDGQTSKLVEFVEVSHAEMTAPLLITRNHLLFASRNGAPFDLIPAGELREGDLLKAMSGSGADSGALRNSSIIGLRPVWAKGFYSPLTTTGRLIVDGVAVSSYALSSPEDWRFSHMGGSRAEETLHRWFLPTRALYRAGIPLEWTLTSPVSSIAAWINIMIQQIWPGTPSAEQERLSTAV